jgi:glycosyltransferase involved in cell wall biosynthesis
VVSLMQVMAGAPVGGAEAFFERLAVALQARSIPQTIVVRGHQDRLQRLQRAGVAPEVLRFGGFFDVTTRAKLGSLIDRTRPQVVLTWMNRATAMCPTPSPARRFVFVARLGGYYNLKYYRRCDHLIANTLGIRRYLIDQGWDPERVHYLPNFVDVDGEDAPRSSSNSRNGRRIFAAGRLHENKGFDVLIRALSLIDDAHLHIAGSGPLERTLKDLADEVGVTDRITWLGWLDNLADQYRQADIFVCPSRHEPLGNVVIEAWAAVCPVIAAAADGPKELIEDGKDGLLVEIEDYVGLAAAINKVLDQPTLGRSMAEAGHARYLKSYSKDIVIEEYVNFFKSVAP